MSCQTLRLVLMVMLMLTHLYTGTGAKGAARCRQGGRLDWGRVPI